MTPTVKTVRMSPAISAWAAVNSRFPQSAERTINELWASARQGGATAKSRVSHCQGVAVTVERARRRDRAADHQSSRVLMRSAPTQYCRISSKGRASALSRATARAGLEKPHAQGGRLFWTGHVFCRCQLLDMHLRRLRTDLAVSCGNVGVGSSSSIISAPAVCAEDLHDLTAACSDCLPAHS